MNTSMTETILGVLVEQSLCDGTVTASMSLADRIATAIRYAAVIPRVKQLETLPVGSVALMNTADGTRAAQRGPDGERDRPRWYYAGETRPVLRFYSSAFPAVLLWVPPGGE